MRRRWRDDVIPQTPPHLLHWRGMIDPRLRFSLPSKTENLYHRVNALELYGALLGTRVNDAAAVAAKSPQFEQSRIA